MKNKQNFGQYNTVGGWGEIGGSGLGKTSTFCDFFRKKEVFFFQVVGAKRIKRVILEDLTHINSVQVKFEK